MTSRLLDTDADLALAAQPSEQVVAGDPLTGSRELTTLRGLEVGVWEMTPGVATDVEADEVFVVLSGEGTVTFEDGEVIELRPGTVVRLSAGDTTVWEVASTLRKLYLA
ncbi:cupin domain-containing protein [Nocardioides sp. Iso805N]|uniref:cupin domain-containing protein n=1 Tax=Nocardioides sp. Iso805N TaxID=1283287 RepID=UPI0003615B8F|nr:cupin domain-containing protein [Nocardioides sp. Iso805N]